MAQGKCFFTFKLSIYFFLKSNDGKTGLLFYKYDWKKNGNRDQHQLVGGVFQIRLIQMV